MPDTMRSLTTLGTILADNISGDITPQDLRDALLATVQPGHAEISITSAEATTLPSPDEWYAASGIFALTSPAMNWDMQTNGQLRYTGAAMRVCHIAFSFSLTAAGNNKQYSFGVAKNGAVLVPSILSVFKGTGASLGSSAAHAYTTLMPNDYLSIVVRGDTDTTAPTLLYANLFVMDMAH